MSPRLLNIFFALVCLLVPTGRLYAGLVFEKTDQTLQVDAGQESVEVLYSFTNTGKESVHIDSVHASCGCTVPTLDKQDYAPGEKGTLTAKFEIGSRTGRKTNHVTLVEGGTTHDLSFTVDIPERISISSKLVLFRAKNYQDPQTVHVAFEADTPVEIISIQSLSEHFGVDWKPVEKGHSYDMTVTMKKASEHQLGGTARIMTRGASGREYSDIVYIRYIP